MTKEALVLTGILHRYDAPNVLDGISFSISPGESVCLTGPNGAGKSTLLRIAGGIMRPTQGEVTINGVDPYKDRRQAQRYVAYLGDVPFFYERLRGLEHLELLAKLKGGEGEPRVEMAQLLGLTHDDLGRPIGSYSLGMKQKLGLVATLGGSQSVVLMDEPFSALDEDARPLARQLISELATKGLALCFVSHDKDDLSLATRVVRLKRGVLV